MSRRQYRWFSSGLWQSQVGNALFAIINPIMSDKKVIIHSIEVHNHKLGSGSNYPAWDLIIGSDTLSPSNVGGEDVSVARHDTSASLASGVVLRKNAGLSSSSNVYMTLIANRLTTASAFLSTAYGSTFFRFRRGRNAYHFDQFDSGTQSLVLRQNEFLAVAGARTTLTNLEGIPVEVQVTFKYNNMTYSATAMPCFLSYSRAYAFILYNTTSTPLYVKRLFVRELGTADTPYFQLVPVGAIDPNTIGDQLRRGTVIALDSNYGAPQSGDPIILVDSPLLPLGVPQQYIADGSSGSPKGYNYLHTKDFVGPTYMTMFPEFLTIDPALSFGGLAWWSKSKKLIDSRFNLTLNEGEGVALVGAAETAVVSAAIGTSGWQPYDFAIQYSVEPKNIPIIRATGIVSGSSWIIQKVSNGATVAQGTVGGNGQIEYTYTTGDTPVQLKLKIRKGTTPPYYKPYEVTFTLTTAGVNIPVSQIPD